MTERVQRIGRRRQLPQADGPTGAISVIPQRRSLFGGPITISSATNRPSLPPMVSEKPLTLITNVLSKDVCEEWEPLGEGGYGWVARCVYKGRPLAVKNVSLTSSEQAQEFMREMKSLKRLSNECPQYVVRYFGSAVDPEKGDGKIYMELVQSDLSRWLKTHQLTMEQARSLIMQLLKGLQCIHDNGFAHRDIKPANIGMTTEGLARYMDFGLTCGPVAACDRDVGASAPYGNLGSTIRMEYGASDQIPMEEEQRADLFALAVVIVDVLVGNAFHYQPNAPVANIAKVFPNGPLQSYGLDHEEKNFEKVAEARLAFGGRFNDLIDYMIGDDATVEGAIGLMEQLGGGPRSAFLQKIQRQPGVEPPRYKVIRELGSGAYGTVVAAEMESGEIVAIKTVDLSRLGESLEERSDTWRDINLRLLGIEVDVLQALRDIDCPGIVSLEDSWIKGGKLHLVMELIQGPSLVELVEKRPLAVSEAAAIMRHLMETLRCIHSHDIVHRDVKLDNVVMSAGRPVLVDYGFSCIKECEIQEDFGTPQYLAPEQMFSEELRPTSLTAYKLADIWALGKTLEVMMMRRFCDLPCKAQFLDLIEEEAEDEDDQEFLEDLYKAALQKDPVKRLKKWMDFQDDRWSLDKAELKAEWEE